MELLFTEVILSEVLVATYCVSKWSYWGSSPWIPV